MFPKGSTGLFFPSAGLLLLVKSGGLHILQPFISQSNLIQINVSLPSDITEEKPQH